MSNCLILISPHGNNTRGVIFLDQQEYSHLNYLALDLIIDARINRLPVDISNIASIYGLRKLIDYSKSRFENTVIVSQHILKMFGYDDNIYYAEYLAVKILSPLIVLRELDVKSYDHFTELTDLPILISALRFDLYKNLVNQTQIGRYNVEKRALRCFSNWIKTIKK